jgi:hypothetical protein
MGSKKEHFYVPVEIRGRNRKANIKVLVDSGASTLFINSEFIKRNDVTTKKLERALPVRNIDVSQNTVGPIREYAELYLKIGDHEEEAAFMVTDIGSDDIIIGIDWLRYHNPEIDWNTGKVALSHCPIKCKAKKKAKAKKQDDELPALLPEEEDEPSEECQPELNLCRAKTKDTLNLENSRPKSINKAKIIEEIEDKESSQNLWIKFKSSVASQLAQEEAKKEKKKSIEEMVPEWLHDYLNVFSEEKSNRFPD